MQTFLILLFSILFSGCSTYFGAYQSGHNKAYSDQVALRAWNQMEDLHLAPGRKWRKGYRDGVLATHKIDCRSKSYGTLLDDMVTLRNRMRILSKRMKGLNPKDISELMEHVTGLNVLLREVKKDRKDFDMSKDRYDRILDDIERALK